MALIPRVASFFLFLTKLSIGQRQVTIQKGPLYRAEGYPASIGCQVAGYRGPSEQQFQWSIYLPNAPTQEIQIISTFDASFTYAKYGQRVRNGEIYVERLGDSSVLLHISKLLAKDSGEYECHTPNTDEQYYGNYSAKTNLIDFTLEPGPLYAKRFAAGKMGLDKLGVDTFRLSIERLQPSDQGQLFCEATEWIQDPDKNWTPITRKHTKQVTLRIQPAVRDFQVHIKAESTFTEGKSLELVCLVVGSGWNPQLQGIWFFNNDEIARIDAGGVLGLKKDYSKRASQGLFQVSKLSPKNFSLNIFSVGPEDEGTYRCEVSEMERVQTGSWQVLKQKQSPEHQVHLKKPTARTVMVSTNSKQQAVWEGEPLALLCQVDGPESALSVSWFHTPKLQAQPDLVACMAQDGTVELGSNNRSNVRLEKRNWAIFQLDITSTAVTDGGLYECRVSERTRSRTHDLHWSGTTLVTVNSLGPSLQIILVSRQPQVQLANTFDLSCLVKADYSDLTLPVTVTWQFQPTESRDYRQFIRITHNGTIEWDDSLPQFQRKTKVSQSPFRSQLLIHDATEEEAGMYQCKVEVYDKNSRHTEGPGRASASSHPLRIDVTLPESRLKVNVSSQAREVVISSNTVIECGILSRSTGNLHLAINWYFSPTATNANWQSLLEMDQTSVVKYTADFHNPQRKQKFHPEKVSQDLFQLHILGVEDGDQGAYRCTVQEWLLSTQGTWYKLGEAASGLTELKLRPTGSEIRVSKEPWTGNVTEHSEVVLRCSLESSHSSASQFSVSWFWGREPPQSQELAHLQHDGLLRYREGAPQSTRLLCYRASAADFVLTLRPVALADAGRYWCRVTEWQLHGNPGKWVGLASDESQPMALAVLPAESTLPSRICSSEPLLYFLLILPFILLILLLASLVYLYWKIRRLATLSCSAQKEQVLWVDMKRTGGDTLSRSREEDEDDS
ncbi:PREDICTED: immunoglobulin superfamily member 2 isoform X2 [Condylura cristata]|uniref:immunoglobulin superfamily member 2 isoform X2 n=1 Tax=Condylura cristata TaxID=143302 RepID=UPI000642F29D|nr:PREDICTED: immunoglobulin superfamily member 2 isoform X2 [Condylura cristata]